MVAIGLALLLITASATYYAQLRSLSNNPSNSGALPATSAAKEAGKSTIPLTIRQLEHASINHDLGALSIEYSGSRISNPIEVHGRIAEMAVEDLIRAPDGPTPDEQYAVVAIAIEDDGQFAFVHVGARRASAPFGDFHIGEKVKIVGTFVATHSCNRSPDKDCTLFHVTNRQLIPDIVIIPIDGGSIAPQT
ncbi:hypothetical protein [Bradyrhizobium elkanii]|uniref:hypothetical protein n=1 Tax=Bradyrhizobium elkanii TaxID=29448 RepID=UPI0020A1F6B6|nr:hypothetical protein [Bradyrhizobium elkanii]